MSIQIRYNINMFKKILLIIAILFLWTIPSTAKAEGFVPVICSIDEFDYCKNIKKIIEYTLEAYYSHEPVKIYSRVNNTIKEYTPDGYYNHVPVKIYSRVDNTIKEYTPNGYYNHEPIKIYILIKY